MVVHLPKAARMDVGTHMPKAPDPTVSSPAFFEASATKPADVPFLCGEPVNARRRIGASGGDAKRTQASRFLRYNIRFGNRTASLGEVMAESRGFRGLLVEAGWPEEAVEQAAKDIEAKASGKDGIDAVHPATKVIFFPLPDGGYRQVSPLHAVPLWFELRNRLLERGRREGAERRTHALRRRSIGGSKAQNVGVEGLDSGGNLELLVSMPPPVRKPLPALDKVLHRVRTQGTAFKRRMPAVHLLVGVRELATDYVNEGIREGRYRALAGIAATFLDGPMTLAAALDAGLELDLDLLADPVERLLVSEGYESLDRQATLSLVARFGSYVASWAMDEADPLFRYQGDTVTGVLERAIEMALDPGSGQEAEAADVVVSDEEVAEEGDDGEVPPAKSAPKASKPAKRPAARGSKRK